MRRNYTTQLLGTFLNIFLYAFKTFCLLYIHLIQNINGHFIVFRCTFQNATYFTPFYVTEKYPMLLKIDQCRDGCYLKHILGEYAGPSVSLSLSCVCSVNIYDAFISYSFIFHLCP